MTAKKFKKILLAVIKALNSLYSSRSYGRLLENSKTGFFRELFLPENDFQTSPHCKILKAWKLTKDMKLRLDFFSYALLHMNSI